MASGSNRTTPFEYCIPSSIDNLWNYFGLTRDVEFPGFGGLSNVRNVHELTYC